MKKNLLLALMCVCGSVAAQNKRADTIILDEIAVKNLRLETVKVEETEFEETVFALGRIEVLPGRSAIVSTRVPGRILSVSVEPDHPVEKGTEIVRIESRQPGEPPPAVRIEAPISGLVAKLDAIPGQPVSPESQLMQIVDLKEVHAIARVPEHLAGGLTKGQRAHMRVSAYPDRTFEAELEHIGSLADAETGTVGAFFHVANPEMLLRPGMRAEFSIVTSTRAVVMTVPREAVQGDASGRFVYLADDELKNAFAKTPVQLGAQNDRFMEITSGLLPGDRAVTRGAYALGFAGKGSVSLQEAMDAAHGHPHSEDGSEMTREQRSTKVVAPTDAGARGFNSLTVFFAGTSALLLVLLVVSLKWKRSALAS